MKRNSPEANLQIAVVKMLSLQRIEGLAWTAVNPSPSKTPAVAALSRAMGMRAGWPDLTFIYQGRPFAIELKASKGRLSDVQIGCQAYMREAGCDVWTCDSIVAVLRVLRVYDVPIRATVMG